MNATDSRRSENAIELPATAPMVRITAGVGSAGQKTWNLRRPVTLVGSRRPAHIVLHDRDVSVAHYVIVNTGSEVLLKDLHTSKGTLCNEEPVDLAVLNDGDVVTVGNTQIQVAIRLPVSANDDSGYGVVFTEPTKLPEPLTLRLEHTDRQWRIDDAVALIGRHKDASIRLDHEDVSTRHAIVFRFLNGPAIYDLGSRTGVSVDGNPCTIAALHDGDRTGIGPCTVAVGLLSGAPVDSKRSTDVGADMPVDRQEGAPASAERPDSQEHPADGGQPATSQEGRVPKSDDSEADPAAAEIGAELAALQSSISESWERLNAWQLRLQENASLLDRRNQDLSGREAELNAKDAALRGHMHDVTRLSEQVAAREKELASQLASIEEERREVAKARDDIANREEEFTRRTAEMKRREHVVAQRWARLLAANCPHCGQGLRPGVTDAKAT